MGSLDGNIKGPEKADKQALLETIFCFGALVASECSQIEKPTDKQMCRSVYIHICAYAYVYIRVEAIRWITIALLRQDVLYTLKHHGSETVREICPRPTFPSP